MTKQVRIENADTSNWPVSAFSMWTCLVMLAFQAVTRTSNWPVRVTVQHKDADGNWVDQPGAVQIDRPTQMTETYLTSHRRLVIEERAADPAPAQG